MPGDGPGLYPSPCCGARSMLLELASAGEESGDAWKTGAPAATESYMRLACTACEAQWKRPRRMVRRADGAGVEI
jgi:hypothetical protein